MTLSWQSFDADFVDPNVENKIKKWKELIVSISPVSSSNEKEIKKYASDTIELYNNRGCDSLNKTIGVSTFRPNEFSHINNFNDSIEDLVKYLASTDFDWRDGSKSVQEKVKEKYTSIGNPVLSGGREKVIIDALVSIKNKKVAIEFETSTNIDNGYFSLREAIKTNEADFGVMVVPWYAKGSGRANEAIATGRLDRECENIDKPIGPIYRIAILRLLDIFLNIQKALT